MNFGESLTWFPLVNLLNLRALILEFSILNIKIRFKETYLGILWTGLEPLLVFVLLYVVFTNIRIGLKEDFAIYLLSGIILYHIFTRGTLGGMTSLRSNAGILKSLNVKREFFPVSSTLAMAILTVVEVGVLFALMPFFQFYPSFTIILIPIPIILLLILILGFSYFLSILHVYVKDIQPIWAVLVQTLLFVSPIFWYLEDAQDILLNIQWINPVGQLIELNHKIVVLGEFPSITEWLYTTTFVFAILFIGYAIFRKYEKRITEEL